MSDAFGLSLFVLSCMGLTILLVWPVDGPSAWVRERVLRKLLPARVAKVLDCYICLSVRIALIAAPFWWRAGFHWSAIAWPVVPGMFWLVMPESRSGGS